MNELGNTPTDKDYKPSGMNKAREAALKAFPGQQFIHDRCVFRMAYEQAEQDILIVVKQYIEKGERCMKQSIDDGEGDLYTFWDGFHNCAENILRELEEKK